MRFGVSTWAFAYPFDPTVDLGLIDRMAELGADHFELGGEALERRVELPLDEMRRRLAGHGMTSSVCGIFGPQRDLSHPDAAIRLAGAEHLRACIEVADSLGSRVVVGAMCGTGGRVVVSDTDRQRRYGLAADELRAAGDFARDRGVVIAVEPINRYENNLLTTQAEARPLVDLVDHPNVGLHVDLFHANIEEESLGGAIRLAGDRMVHCHAVDNHRGGPGTGSLAWGEVRSALADVGYDGALVIEAFDPGNPGLAEFVSIWRPVASSQDALVRSGLTFLRALVGAAASAA